MRFAHHISFRGFSACLRTVLIGRWTRLGVAALGISLPAATGCQKSESTSPRGNLTTTSGEQGGQATAEEAHERIIPWSADGGRPGAVPSPSVPSGASRRAGWSVILATITDPQHDEIAARWAEAFSRLTGLRGAWIESDERGSIVRYGSYESAESEQAQADLRRIKGSEVNGQFPFRGAYLGRHGAVSSPGQLSEFSLPHARRLYPGVETLYSLQIGVYEAERETTAEQARRLAEQAVVQLRAQNELAFFYHGPNRSMVCIGVFLENAVDPGTGLYSAEVRRVQERHPYNSYNGRTLEESITGADGRVRKVRQSSFLVAVPKE